jgi:hypothetical protein
MSLNYNLTNVKDYDDLWKDDQDGGKRLVAEAEALILSTMALGFRGLTAKNRDEVLARMRFREALHGPFLAEWVDGKRTPIPYPEEWLDRMIGFTTNADDLTWAKWSKQVADNWRRDYDYRQRSARKDG